MDAPRFDLLTRLLFTKRSRRQVLAALALGVLGLSALPDESPAGPGCRNVGRKCKKAKQCCSGICKGKKGEKRCRAHDTGGCQAGAQETGCGGTDTGCTTSTGHLGVCDTTTGNAGYCTFGFECVACHKDADCRELCGPAAACIRCLPECPGTGGTACVGPSAGDCVVPP